MQNEVDSLHTNLPRYYSTNLNYAKNSPVAFEQFAKSESTNQHRYKTLQSKIPSTKKVTIANKQARKKSNNTEKLRNMGSKIK